MIIVKPCVEILHPDLETESINILKRLEQYGRVCYKSENKITDDSYNKFIRMLVSSGHLSVIEHEKITVKFICSRSTSHQLVRHRLASYCLTGDTMIHHHISTKGQHKRTSIIDLYDKLQKPQGIGQIKRSLFKSVDLKTGLVVSNKIKNIVYNGKKECVEIILSDKYKIKSTLDHKFWSDVGWKNLEDIIKDKNKLSVNGIELTKEFLTEYYINLNKSGTEICNEFNLQRNYFDYWVRKFKIKKPNNYNKLFSLTKEFLENQYKQHKTTYRIAKDTGYSDSAIKNYLYRYGIKLIPNNLFFTKEELFNLFIDQNMTKKEIANKYNISEDMLKIWLFRFNINKPQSIKRKNRKGGKGRIKGSFSIEELKKLSESKKGINNKSWKGGITKRKTNSEYKKLKEKIFQRDNYTCLLCGCTEKINLCTHHVIPFCERPDLLSAEDNIVTVCNDCHLTKINGNEWKYIDYFLNFPYIKKYATIEKYRPETGIIFLPIQKINYIGMQDVYDVQMLKEPHNFVADGFVVHNSQESQRFCNYTKDKFNGELQVIIPESIREAGINSDQYNYWLESVCQSEVSYTYLISLGIKPEDARSVLPNCCKTEIVTTLNLRAWYEMLPKRCDNHAQQEIRDLCKNLLYQFDYYLPQIFENLYEIVSNKDLI